MLNLVLEKMPVSISSGLWSTLSDLHGLHPARHTPRRCGTGSRFDVASSAVVLVG
ncbi:MAG: hypothetical protein WDN49_12455 [Acetobacteraceae bacterium]